MGREGGGELGRSRYCMYSPSQGCLPCPSLLNRLVRTLIYYHTHIHANVPDGAQSLTSPHSLPGAPRISCPSWLPPPACRVVRGRLSLARFIHPSIPLSSYLDSYRKQVLKKALSFLFFLFYRLLFYIRIYVCIYNYISSRG